MVFPKRGPEGRAELLQLVQGHFAGDFEVIRREIPTRNLPTTIFWTLRCSLDR
jgi:hypothetical protein